MKAADLFQQIQEKQSYLCLGLDPEKSKLPAHLLSMDDPIFEFNKAIVDATADSVVALKPNLAFYESEGLAGWQSLDKTVAYCRENYPELFLIADAKRGDIGNTARKYADAFFTSFPFDAITLSPYMGRDSIQPFLDYPDKWGIVLGLTSNSGSADFQLQELVTGDLLFEKVMSEVAGYGSTDSLMFVVGATRADYIRRVRELVPEHFLLVPGVGAQGGSLDEVSAFGLNKQGGLLVNSSRGIIYASQGADFAEAAQREALNLQRQMKALLERYC